MVFLCFAVPCDESPTAFKANGTYYWVGSNKTGWRANNNFYFTASSMTGTWTCQGYIAPVTDTSDTISNERTWLSQSTWVQPIVGSKAYLPTWKLEVGAGTWSP